MPDQWSSLKTNPPGPEHKLFFIGSSTGGRLEFVFRWPNFDTGKPEYWKSGEHGNFLLNWEGADVWYPGPPEIPGSWADQLQQGQITFEEKEEGS